MCSACRAFRRHLRPFEWKTVALHRSLGLLHGAPEQCLKPPSDLPVAADRNEVYAGEGV